MNKNLIVGNIKFIKEFFLFHIKKTIEDNDFRVTKFYGGPFLYASENKNSIIKKTLNKVLQYLLDKKIFVF